MISLVPIIAALKNPGTPFKFAGGAIDLVTAGDHLKIFPAAYALPLTDAGSPNRAAVHMASIQQVSERFGVMYAFRNLRAGAGDKVQEEARVGIEWARAQLQGLSLDADHDLVEFESGELVSFADEMMIYLDRYITSKDMRKV